MQQGVQTDATCNIHQCWELLVNNVPSVCMGLQTTTNIAVAPTMLGVVTSALAVVCKRMQQLPIMLGPVVHCGKDTTHKTFETFVLLDGSNFVVQRFGDHGTTEMLGVLGSKIQTFRNNFQQHATLCENGRNMLHPTMLGVVGQQCCVLLRGALQFFFLYSIITSKSRF